MKIAIGSDHAGFSLKEVLKEHLTQQGHEILDVGTHSDSSCDYPDYAKQVALLIAEKTAEFGVLVCGTGIGMCIAANRAAHVRAVVIRDDHDAKMSRLHNDANVACFGGRITAAVNAVRLIDLFLSTKFEGGRHLGRVEKLDA